MNYSKLSDAALEQLATGNVDYAVLPDSDLQEIVKAESYKSPGQKLIAGLEGAARGATMGLSTGLEVAAGIDPEDIRAREEADPTGAFVGETAGMIATGGAGLLAKAGAAAAKMAVSRAGAMAAGMAAQAALAQSGKEVHKLLAEDPEQSFGTALTNIGTAAALGGGLGAAGSSAAQLGSKVVDKAASTLEKLRINPKKMATWAAESIPDPFTRVGVKKLIDVAMPEELEGAMGRALGSMMGMDKQALHQASAYAKELIAGNKLVNASVSAVFNQALTQVIPDSKIPSIEARRRLESTIESMSTDPIKHSEDASSHMGAYLEGEAGALGATMARAASYLQSIKPVEAKLGPLDPPAPISKDQTAKYQRALSIAEQPLLVLQHIKQGSLTADDVVTLESVHPATSALLKQRLMNQLVEHSATGQKLPYKIAMSLSLLFGTPLEASLSPQNIMGNQSIGVPPKPEEARQNAIVNAQQGKSLQDLPKAAATGAQSREATRQMRK